MILTSSSVCYAGGSSKGDITGIEFTASGKVLFGQNGTRSAPPTCVGANFSQRWAIDGTTEGGKAQLSGLLMAYASGKKITIRGADHCNVWGDTETVKDFWTY